MKNLQRNLLVTVLAILCCMVVRAGEDHAPVQEGMGTVFIAHRGLIDGSHAENTLEAILSACQSEVWGVEYDVRLTQDGRLVVIHDETIDRTSDGKGKVRHLALKELREHNFGCRRGLSGIRIPAFEEAFELCEQYHKHQIIEIKDEGAEAWMRAADLVAEMILSRDAQERAVVASFMPAVLQYVKERHPGIRVRLFVGKGTAERCSRNGRLVVVAGSAEAQCLAAVESVGLRFDCLSEDIVGELHRRGLLVGAWGDINGAECRRLAEMGVDDITMENFGTLHWGGR
ncbi:MAG: hypothetical protein IKS83_06570 [Victivallales bacterium]|nr:hypothetical protein [Victivallales bacterium]